MVTVDNDVQLEVLDWGGMGRPVVLLAGSGNTAHIYDDFAPKLAEICHVYGITRRGYGLSSSPANGYSVHRQADDIIAVLDALKINRPILIGHSLAGQELSAVVTRIPNKIAGAVYIDAAYSYAFYDSSVGGFAFDLPELQKKLERLNSAQGDAKLIDELLQNDLPRMEKELRQKKQMNEFVSELHSDRATPTARDLASFAALGAWYKKNMVGGNPPEIELYLSFETNQDGSVGKPRTHPVISSEDLKWEKFTNIPVPVLAIYACPIDYGPMVDDNPAFREKFDAFKAIECQDQANALQKDVPTARVILWPHTYHYLFIARRDDVLSELSLFLNGLPE